VTHVFDWDTWSQIPPDERLNRLGGKAANLGIMAAELGLPVPPAFTITTASCNAYLANGWPDGLDAEIRSHLAGIERRVGRRFGDATDPLLLSVRSGAPVSMPGMMDTILNLGLNDATTDGLARSSGSPAFAADCRRRFEEMFREIVGVAEVPDDPWSQLRSAIEAVFRSWNSERATTYRRREGIPDDLGTAVTVQAMVFGNHGPDSATGVLFTRDPATGGRTLYGDVMFEAQGEDVVAGTHPTLTLGELEARLPEVGRELRGYADALERHYADMCDIEFTIERGKLWLLQCRIGKRSPQAALRIAVEMAEDADFPLDRRGAVERVAPLLVDPPRVTTSDAAGTPPLATGLPASPGLAAGQIATTAAVAIQAADDGRPVILVRPETSPDDVRGMARAAGLLTSRGGLASHAAVVARGWGIPAVVGASGVTVAGERVMIGGRPFPEGSPITVNGSTGEVFEGVVAGSSRVVPEAETLLGWARDLGIEIGDGVEHEEDAGGGSLPVQGQSPAAVAGGPGTVDREVVLCALAIKGQATIEGLAEALLAAAVRVDELVDGLVAAGEAERSGGSITVTASGREAAGRVLATERGQWGNERAGALLESFHLLDGRMKEIVTAWQLREVGGSQVVNDHADPAYDQGVLAQLGALHADADAWLAPLAAAVKRYELYRARLDRAARLAAGGDARYVASPRVDSYHTAWFELHEDLILLAGRTRADEVAAGRA